MLSSYKLRLTDLDKRLEHVPHDDYKLRNTQRNISLQNKKRNFYKDFCIEIFPGNIKAGFELIFIASSGPARLD